MFDDIVDHAHYDHCNDWKTRIKLMHEVLDQVVNLDQDKLLVETKSRRLYNQQQLQSKDLIDSLLKPIVNDLAKYFT
jgi:predicted metallo-beta-lactamase superfamily hydrolase